MTALPPKWVWSVNSTEALAESCKTKPGLQAVLLGDGLERSHEWLTMNFRQCGASISASLFRLHDFNFPPVAFTLLTIGECTCTLKHAFVSWSLTELKAKVKTCFMY